MPAKRIVPLIVAVALFMENMDSTVIATSLPAIAADIGTSPLTLKLAVTSYLLSLAVVMDATLIRATLVPAFMRLAVEANWWAPKPLRRLFERYGLKEAEPVGAGATAPGPASVEGAKP